MKIKFPDTGQIIEVTEPSQLANTKFYCRDKSELNIIESLGFRKYQGEDPYYKDQFGVTVSLWDDMEYSRSIGFDDTGKPFREFIFLPSLSSPSELQEGESNGWISVKDRQPEEGTEILAFFDFGDRTKIETDTWSLKYSEMNGITHWMPLPSPPKTSTCYKDNTKQCTCPGVCREAC